jgi:hypothetical protein
MQSVSSRTRRRKAAESEHMKAVTGWLGVLDAFDALRASVDRAPAGALVQRRWLIDEYLNNLVAELLEARPRREPAKGCARGRRVMLPWMFNESEVCGTRAGSPRGVHAREWVVRRLATVAP